MTQLKCCSIQWTYTSCRYTWKGRTEERREKRKKRKKREKRKEREERRERSEK